MPEQVMTALETAMSALADLDRRCCEVGRSPRLAQLGSKLVDIRRLVERPDGATSASAVVLVEEAGAMVGALQVGCCAPNRLPLYATLLEQLNVVQRHLAPMH